LVGENESRWIGGNLSDLRPVGSSARIHGHAYCIRFITNSKRTAMEING